MNKNLAAVFLALAFANACFGLDISTRTGTTYRKCEVVKVEPDGIRITHDAGAAKIEFEDLPDALKRQYNFDPANVAAYRKTIADAKAAAEEKVKVERARLEAARQKEAANAKAAEDLRLAAERETAAAQEQERIKKLEGCGSRGAGHVNAGNLFNCSSLHCRALRLFPSFNRWSPQVQRDRHLPYEFVFWVVIHWLGCRADLGLH